MGADGGAMRSRGSGALLGAGAGGMDGLFGTGGPGGGETAVAIGIGGASFASPRPPHQPLFGGGSYSQKRS